jgi:hypothetical protein
MVYVIEHDVVVSLVETYSYDVQYNVLQALGTRICISSTSVDTRGVPYEILSDD